MLTEILKKYENAIQEKNDLKRRLAHLEKNLAAIALYFRHVATIQQSRKQAKIKELISQKDFFEKLGI